ncbi:MAG: ThuA domain-containing protein [Bacteroidota bacterium]
MCLSKILRLSFLLLICHFIGRSLFAQDTLILYTETTGFNHQTADESLIMFQQIGLGHDFVVRHDEDGSLFNKTDLGEAQIVVFSNTSGSSGLNLQQQAALEWFVDTLGRHLLGIHAASDTYRHSSANGGNQGAWDWYAETLGGSVQNGPNHTSSSYIGTINEIIPHPSIENIDFPWVKEEEYYYWQNGYLNDDIQVVMEVDTTGEETYDVNRPVAWFREGAAGARIFYTSLGHKRSNFTGGFPFFEQLIEDAVLWMLEDIDVSTDDHLLVSGDISLFPNPVRESLNLHLHNPELELIIELYDLHGRLINGPTLMREQHITFDVSNLSAGLYLLLARNGEQTLSWKIAIK